MGTQAQTHVDTFTNPNPGRNYEIIIDCPEFTCLCPMTGQPDFAELSVMYIPDQLCVELKSLKLYFWSFRDRGGFHEAVVNEILDHLVAGISPRFMEISARFNVRGGITTKVIARHAAENFVRERL